MTSTTDSRRADSALVSRRSRPAHGGVPVVRRQLLAEPTKNAITVAAVGASVALVLLLSGLRRGMAEQVTVYLDHQAPVLVAQKGARNFLSQTSFLPGRVVRDLERVRGVAEATPISQQYAMLPLHGRPTLALLVGYDPRGPGGPWALSSGRPPSTPGELVLDRVLAGEHDLELGSALDYRGTRLRIVGLSRGTSGFMLPLAFATRTTVDAFSRQPGLANFVFVRPDVGVSPDALASRLERAVRGISALTRREVAASDRRQFVDPFSVPLVAMVAIAFAVAVLVVGLSVYGSTAERSREYATLKALGLRRSSLYRLVTAHAFWLTSAGAALGIALAFASARGVSSLAPKYAISITAGSAIVMVASAVAIALVAAWLPARFLANLDPASAFRR